VALLRKVMHEIRHPMGLRHPVVRSLTLTCVCDICHELAHVLHLHVHVCAPTCMHLLHTQHTCVCTYMYASTPHTTHMCVHLHVRIYSRYAWDWESLYRSETSSLSAKEPLIIRLFCGKWLIKIGILWLSTPPCIGVRVWEVGGWGRDPKKCTGRDWGMGSSTI